MLGRLGIGGGKGGKVIGGILKLGKAGNPGKPNSKLKSGKVKEIVGKEGISGGNGGKVIGGMLKLGNAGKSGKPKSNAKFGKVKLIVGKLGSSGGIGGKGIGGMINIGKSQPGIFNLPLSQSQKLLNQINQPLNYKNQLLFQLDCHLQQIWLLPQLLEH